MTDETWYTGQFESLVNLEGCKTAVWSVPPMPAFESLVNLEGCKTPIAIIINPMQFESLVNLEGCKTLFPVNPGLTRLRVLLI